MRYGLLRLGKKSILTNYLKQTRIIVLSFVIVIIIGALLLSLPAASTGEPVPFIDALFTAASATCVTGLTTVTVGSNLSAGGQAVVLLLIQIGGMGFMTLATATFVMMGKRFSLREKLNMRDYLSESDMSSLNRLAINVVKLTLIVEAAGAVALTICFAATGTMGFGYAVWYGVFHSVSAFCNAGLDVASATGESFAAFAGNPAVLITLSALIIIGGLGFIAIGDILQKRRPSRLRPDTKIVCFMTAILLILGTVVLLVSEYNNPDTIGNMSFGDKLANAFFYSVSTRTAGFCTFGSAALRPASRSFVMALMFIGASPGSTGGGIKTTTLFVLVVWILAHIRNKRSTVISMRRIGAEVQAKAATIFVAAVASIAVAHTLLLACGGIAGEGAFELLLFEAISAYATVGLSMGVTPLLSAGGKVIIILLMFMGRVGAYTLLHAATRQEKTPDNIKYPEFNIMM